MTPEERALQLRRRQLQARLVAAGATTGEKPGPDGMTRAERIAAAKAGTLPQPSEARLAAVDAFDRVAEVQMQNAPTAFGSFMGNLAPGVTFGFADEMAAGVGSLLGDGSYSEILEGLRAREAEMMRDQPEASIAGQVTGAVMSPATKIFTPAAGPSLGGNVARGAASGAAAGTVYGFGTGEGGFDERAQNALSGGLGGALIGGAIPVVGRYARQAVEGIANSRAAKAALAAAPSLDDLRAQASTIYAQADNAAPMPRAAFTPAATGMMDDATRSGMDDMLTPGAARVASRMDDAAKSTDPNIGFRELDILRRQAAVPAGNVANRTEASIGTRMIEGIDDFIETVDPALSGPVREARAMWATLKRSDTVERAIERAKLAASGFENGLRTEFRAILKNPKLVRGFNQAEIAAMKQVAQGTAMGNLMRQVGRIGIGLSGQSNGLGATVGGLGVAALSSPLMGAGAVALGTGMKALAERSTRRAAQGAQAMVAGRNALAGLPQANLPGIENFLSIAGRGTLPQGAVPIGNALAGR